MNWGLDINTLFTLLSVAALTGIGWTRLNVLERDLERVEKEVVDSRELRAALAVMQTRLNDISTTLDKLINRLEDINQSGAHK